MWVKLSDRFAGRPEILKINVEARWLHVAAFCYAASYLTDGLIPAAEVPHLGRINDPQKAVEQLVEVGLWERDGKDYRIVGYLEDQWSRDRYEDYNEKARERMAKRRQKATAEHVRANTERTSDELPSARGRDGTGRDGTGRDGTRDEGSEDSVGKDRSRLKLEKIGTRKFRDLSNGKVLLMTDTGELRAEDGGHVWG